MLLVKSITTQKQAQPSQKLSFCCLCGKGFDPSSIIDREHVVARNLIHQDDRNYPIILPSHKSFNNSVSEDDETVGQLIQLLHSTQSKSHKIKLTGFYKDQELKAGTVQGVPFERIIWRWSRGFHVALYGSPLADTPGTYTILAPLPEVTENGGKISRLPVRDQFYMISEVIRKNREANNLDVIDCYNGKLRYETV